MKTIPVRNSARPALVDDEDYERVSRYKWRLDVSGYAIRTLNVWVDGVEKQRWQPLQREIMGRKEGFVMDHKNGDRLDNRKENLRFCTSSQNNMNSRKKVGKYGFRGVGRDGNVWIAKIRVNRKITERRGFASAEDAARGYDEMARELHGDFAVLNFP